ncbi:hypothetical protein HZC30_03290 [Candidatus Woesearchaeota archaeon]|nr:hypothetical protein [Candidatus Woesearchaeota archaeon]
MVLKELKNLKKDTERAKDWVAAEFSYAKNLQVKLKDIEKLETSQAEKNIRSGLKILRWVGRGERRADRYERRVMDELKKLGNILPKTLKDEEEDLSKELDVVEAKLVKAASIFTGDLRGELLELETDEQLLAHLQKKKPQEADKIKRLLHQLVEKTENEVDDLMKWIGTTEAVLKKIEGFEAKLEKLSEG